MTKRLISLRLEDTLVDWLDAFASRSGVDRTAVISQQLELLRAEQEAVMQVDIIQNGAALRSIAFNGENYRLVASTGDFQVRLRNDAPRRRLVVLSVDGVNVIDGSTASWEGGGYLLAPYQTLDVPGWLKSHSEVAKFSFAPSQESYAAQTGRGTTNVGVIGAAVFDEHVPRTMIRRRDETLGVKGPGNGMLRGGLLSASAGPSLSKGLGAVGAAYGEDAAFATQAVEFRRASSSPNETVVVRYGTRDQLMGWGVPALMIDQQPLPNPFPAAGFVPPPPGR